MPTSIEERLGAYARQLDIAAGNPASRTDDHGPPQRRGLRFGIAAATVAAAAGLIVAVGRDHGDPDTATLATMEHSSTAESTAAATMPLETVAQPANGWKAIARAPFVDREDAAAVWTGTEFVVWGGRAGNMLFQQGAAYDPATDTWRRIASNQWAGVGTASVWTGSEMIVLFKNGGAAYDPVANSWRDINGAGVEGMGFIEATWTGSAVSAIGGVIDSAGASVIGIATYSPATDTWETGTPSAITSNERLQFAAIPTGYVVWAPRADGSGVEVWTYRSSSDTWSQLPALTVDELSAQTIDASLVVPTASGWGALLTVTGAANGATLIVSARFDGTAWRTTAWAGSFVPTQAVAVRDGTVVFGSRNGLGVTALLDADGRMVESTDRGPQATNGLALAWSGDRLLAWGGRAGGDSVADPAWVWVPAPS